MQAVLWSDYLCPWAYLGRDRTRVMRELGVQVTPKAFELHPHLPSEGVAIRPDSRLARVFEVIGAECAELGIPFVAPARTPNTRHVLETAEVVRSHWPDAFEALDESFARAHWVEGLDLWDRDLVDELTDRAGAPVAEVRDLVADGVGTAAVSESMTEARSLGVTATPAWWVNEALLIPGAQPRETITRWITRLQARAAADSA